MCIPLSGIICRPMNGDSPRIIYGEYTDSHETLIALHDLREGPNTENFARFEYSPKDPKVGDWGDCRLKIDEPMRPGWLDDEVLGNLQGACENWVKRITISENRKAIAGGTWIIAGKVKIDRAENCRFFVGKGSDLTLGDISTVVAFGGVSGTVTTGYVSGTVTTGDVSGTVATGSVKSTT